MDITSANLSLQPQIKSEQPRYVKLLFPLSSTPPHFFFSQETLRSVRVDTAEMRQTIARGFVAQEMDSEIVVCDLAAFQKHYLPFVP